MTLCFELVGRPVIWRGQGLQEEGGSAGDLVGSQRNWGVWVVKGILMPFLYGWEYRNSC